MKLLPLALFSIALGLLTSVLAAFIFLIWFDAWWKRHEIDAHLSAAMPSPSVRCDGGMEGDERKCTGCEWTGRENDCLHGQHTANLYLCPVCFRDTERLDRKPALEPVELPREFAELFKRKDWR